MGIYIKHTCVVQPKRPFHFINVGFTLSAYCELSQIPDMLTPDIKNSEIFPDSFDAVRKDRASDAHVGVFIAFKRDLLCTKLRNWTPTAE